MIFCSDELPNAGMDRLVLQPGQRDKVPLIVVSRLDDWDRFLHFLQRGAFYYVVYPFQEKEIELVVSAAIGAGRLLKISAVPQQTPHALKKGA